MTNDKNAKENILNQNGLKSTVQRKLIIEALGKDHRPLSAEDIFLTIKEGHASISLSTVYRSLEKMVNSGLLNKCIFDDGIARYEINGTEHKHRLICMGCSKTVDINKCPIKELERSITQETEFDITSHRVELYGYCPKCKTNGESQSNKNNI